MADSATVRRWGLLHLVLFALAAVIFTAWPGIDLAVARLFFHDGRWIGETDAAEIFRRVAAWIVFGVPAIAVALFLFGRFTGRGGNWRAALVLVLSLALGPGLIVNVGFKDHWGRARPSQVVEFGRDRTFTPALKPTDQCARNCSFASGEVAMGFGLVVLALLMPRRRTLWLVPGLALGTAMAIVRMAGGGHFLSDVIFAGLIASATGLAVYAVVYRGQAAEA